MAFAALAIGVSIFGALGSFTPAKASGNDIVPGGIWGRDLGSKCGGDVRAIMDHYWIDCNLSGVVDGRVCRDGNVYVGDRVVARNSTSIGREPIQGSHPISIGGQTYYETHNSQALLSQCLDAFVKLNGNSFKYAIIKACGNPIWTPEPVVDTPAPTPTPTPTPTEKYITVCDLSTKKIKIIKESEYSSSWHTKNLDLCKEKIKTMKVCELSTKATVTIKEGEFNAEIYSTDFNDCKETPKPITVCDLTSHKMISIEEKDYDSTKHSRDKADCEMCAYNPELPKDSTECVAPTALPQTGAMDSLIGGGLGIGSTIVAASFYIASRRDLISAFLNR